MEISKYDIYSYQILNYLVREYHYQVVRVEQHKDDIWLMNAKEEHYPVIQLSSKRNTNSQSDTDYIRNVHHVILNLIHREGPILILNTNPESTPIESDFITQICVNTAGISNTDILRNFKNLDRIPHDVNDTSIEFAKLTKSIEESQLKDQKDMLRKARMRLRPKATIALIILCVVISLSAFAFCAYINDLGAGLVASGAYYKMNIVAAHEYWRLFTAGFIHSDVFHLTFNMFALFQIGKLCEPLFKKTQFIIMIFISVIIGNTFMLIGNENVIAVGIGAGIFGCAGAYFASIIQKRSWRLLVVKISMFQVAWMSFIVCLLPGISILAHLGGLISGIALYFIFSDRIYASLKKHITVSASILLVGLIFLTWNVKQVQPLEKDLDIRVLEVYRNTAMNEYAQYLQTCYLKQYQLEEEL